METGKCLVLADSSNSPGVLLLSPEDIYPSRWIEFDREKVNKMILRVSQSLKISQFGEGKRYWRNRTQFSVRNSELISWCQMGESASFKQEERSGTLLTVTANQDSSIPLCENKNWDLFTYLEAGTHDVAQTSLELKVALPQSQVLGLRPMQPHLVNLLSLKDW